MKKGTIIILCLTALVVGGIVFGMVAYSRIPGPYDAFAQCLKDKGAKFYGAFWCPHCQSQKQLFGKSARLLPYVECSPANGKGQLQICVDNEIKGYPTWIFADGSRLNESSLEELAEKTSCALPQ